MDIVLHPPKSADVTVVPNAFIDRFMTEATGEYVKIYLYLLRHLGGDMPSFSVANVARDLGHTQLDVKRALSHWESEGLINLEYDENHELSSIFFLDIPEPKKEEIQLQMPTLVPAEPEVSPVVAINTDPYVSIEDNDKLIELFYFAERIMGHTLSESAVSTILYWHEELSLSSDLIQYLIEYCTEKQHPNIHYMNQVALNWASEGISTVEEAMASSSDYSDNNYVVKSAFGITGRSLTNPELSFINRWIKFYKFPLEIIKEACERTIIKSGKASFEYADGILRNWHENNVTSLSDIEALDALHAKSKQSNIKKIPAENRFQNFTQRSYDYEAIQRKLSGS